jgi:hypothetical protein
MGNLKHFDLKHYIDFYGIRGFIETGTGAGASLEYAKKYDFELIYSIEIIDSLYQAAVKKFVDDSRITILKGSSREQLDNILPKLSTIDSILFWLDAHYPGADYGLKSYHDPSITEDIRLPLETELKLIKSIRPTHRDVFLIDDLRIYLPGNYSAGSLPWEPKGNIDFISELFVTHTIRLDYAAEGYIILCPKL